MKDVDPKPKDAAVGDFYGGNICCNNYAGYGKFYNGNNSGAMGNGKKERKKLSFCLFEKMNENNRIDENLRNILNANGGMKEAEQLKSSFFPEWRCNKCSSVHCCGLDHLSNLK